ncbi:MAG TPA: hypothetical protein VFP44_04290 [Usitatibacter sp.]|nr:hypothetical protein [Usitatibacter sp.]
MNSDTLLIPSRANARQRIEFANGDEAAALAARAAAALDLSAFEAEDGAALAASCHGAALGGTRVIAATGSQGLLPALAELVAQSTSRVPMVLNAACDHAELYDVLNAGWIVLCAREPQAVYDLDLAAVRIGEHPDVRLPVLVAYDAFTTRHEKRRLLVVDDADALAAFLGERPAAPSPLDTNRPATFGAHGDEADLAVVRAQVSEAMEAARRVIFDVLGELGRLTGRFYSHLDAYDMQEAEIAIVLLNSASEAAKEAADIWRATERKAGVLSPNVLRPFPAKEFRAQLRGVKAATVAERADSYGAVGGNLSIELRAALQQDPGSDTRILTRIYGKAFHPADAERLLDDALVAAATGQVRDMFAYHGTAPIEPPAKQPRLPRIRREEVSRGLAKVRRNAQTGRLDVELEPLWRMTAVPSRIAPGHGACPGCGAFTTLHQVFKVLEGDVVALFQSGCATVVSTRGPFTAHRVNFVHEPATHGASTLSGLMEAWRERVRRGELPDSKDVTFVMVTGDGAMEAGLADAVAAANRGSRMIILEYDNQGRMSAGAQPTQSLPGRAAPRTSDTPQVMAACHVPYVFTASEAYPEDLMRKAAKAQWYATNEGLAYGKVLSFCPLHWRTADDAAQPVLQAAIDSCSFPLYEVERGHTAITYDPDATGRRRPVAEWLKLMGRTAHLVEPAHADTLAALQAETDRRWARLKAKHEHPLL